MLFLFNVSLILKHLVHLTIHLTQNKHKIVRSLGDETEGSALTCRPRLKNHRMLSSLSDEAKGYFEKMFDKAQKTIDVGLSGT